ncbi:hypothetical protein ACHAPT_009133 [Fusarium lateritium]
MTWRGFHKARSNRHYITPFPRDVSTAAIRQTANQFGLGHLAKLPAEVLSTIRGLSEDSYFWTAAHIMATYLEIRALPYTPYCA